MSSILLRIPIISTVNYKIVKTAEVSHPLYYSWGTSLSKPWYWCSINHLYPASDATWPVVDLDIGVHLRTTVLCSLFIFIGSWLPFPVKRLSLIWDGWAASCLGLCCAAAHNYQPQVLAVVSMHHPDLQNLSPVLGPFFQPRSSPSSLRQHLFPFRNPSILAPLLLAGSLSPTSSRLLLESPKVQVLTFSHGHTHIICHLSVFTN